MIVVVTGSRLWDNEDRLQRVMGHVRFSNKGMIVRHGADRQGADSMVARWCEMNGVPEDRMPVKHRSEVPARNLEMMTKEPRPGLCIAFVKNHSHGALACADLARQQGIVTIVFEDDDIPVLDVEG